MGPFHPKLLFLHLLVIIILHAPATRSEPIVWVACSNESSYNAIFRSNLNILLPALSAAAPTGAGFSNQTAGRPPDRAFGLALCRADLADPLDCHNCLNSSIQDFARNCTGSRTAALWYDSCMIRYSDRNFFSSANTSFRFFLVSGARVPDPTLFTRILRLMMDTLIERAAYGSARMYAIGEADYTSSIKLYAMVQCTRDLSGEECHRCLGDYFEYIPKCCDGSQGARVFGWSCKLQYETHPFYNLSAEDIIFFPSLSPAPAPAPSIVMSITPDSQSPDPDTDTKGKENTWTLVLFVVIPIVGVLALFSSIYACFKRRRKVRRKISQDGAFEVEITTPRTILFDLSGLRDATDNFSDANKLGQGGFGSVYKGVLPDGQQIAVKRLSRSSSQGIVELRNEVDLVAKLQHRNLVTLLGFCLGEQEKLLVYEYLSNGSLDRSLFGNRPDQKERLDWRTRYKIIEGIGRGLRYLHEDSRLKIIHRDLKASNILLDGDMNPKISDFGLARLFGVNETQRITRQLAGTYGYMPPEYIEHKRFSTKSDVYSYGVLVLEIVTGRKNSGFEASDNASSGLLGHAWKQWNEEKAAELVDQNCGDFQLQEVLRCIHIGLLCVQGDPKKRPDMASVTLMLSTHLIAAPPPSAPGFYKTEVASSVNLQTITEVQPR